MKHIKFIGMIFIGCAIQQAYAGGPAGTITREVADTTADTVAQNVSREAGEVAAESAQVASKPDFAFHKPNLSNEPSPATLQENIRLNSQRAMNEMSVLPAKNAAKAATDEGSSLASRRSGPGSTTHALTGEQKPDFGLSERIRDVKIRDSKITTNAGPGIARGTRPSPVTQTRSPTPPPVSERRPSIIPPMPRAPRLGPMPAPYK